MLNTIDTVIHALHIVSIMLLDYRLFTLVVHLLLVLCIICPTQVQFYFLLLLDYLQPLYISSSIILASCPHISSSLCALYFLLSKSWVRHLVSKPYVRTGMMHSGHFKDGGRLYSGCCCPSHSCFLYDFFVVALNHLYCLTYMHSFTLSCFFSSHHHSSTPTYSSRPPFRPSLWSSLIILNKCSTESLSNLLI